MKLLFAILSFSALFLISCSPHSSRAVLHDGGYPVQLPAGEWQTGFSGSTSTGSC